MNSPVSGQCLYTILMWWLLLACLNLMNELICLHVVLIKALMENCLNYIWNNRAVMTVFHSVLALCMPYCKTKTSIKKLLCYVTYAKENLFRILWDWNKSFVAYFSVAVNRVATYRELDNDLLKQAAFLTLVCTSNSSWIIWYNMNVNFVDRGRVL